VTADGFVVIRVEPGAESGEGLERYRAERDLRWRVLRAPLGRPRGSEENPHEREALHWVAVNSDDRGQGDVIGCVLLHVLGGEGKLMQMAVDPARQGAGVGRALVAAVFAEATARGLASVALNARETAVGFYARCGCVVEGEPFEEVGLPHRRMRWRLAEGAA
jgi:GNAT superfamily N-acetyltransferase